jgi:non-ribosomal peptide synthetase component F
VVNPAIHRVIEQQAASHPDALAVVDGARALTYRELNQRSNALARHLITSGFTRGGLALVKIERSADLALTLLAVLKAGGAYTWIDPASERANEAPYGFTIVQRASGDEQRFLALDLRATLSDESPRTSPNLPILTRGSDVACVLPSGDDSPHVLVPHATVTSLNHGIGLRSAQWGHNPGAFDLWVSLMSGGTATVNEPLETAAA